jgi:iron complex outermembrane receptor protein
MKKTVLLASGAISALAIQQPAFAAEVEPVEIKKLTVTADPLGGRTEDELISAVTVIAGDTLDRKKSTTLGETLDGLPGVTNSDFGPGVGRPVIRGLTGSRVKTLNNGLGTADLSGEGGDHNIAIDPGSATQIEVLRGPATLLYGGNAAGGIINVINEDFSPDFSDDIEVGGQLTYGENGDQRLGNTSVAIPLSDDFVIRSRYGIQRSNDFDIDGYQQTGQTQGKKDKLQNSDVDSDSFSLTALYNQDWGFAALGYSRWETEYGIPEVFLGEGEEEQERIEADYDRFDFRSEVYDPFSGIHTARIKLAYTEFEQAESGSEFHDGVLEESGVEAEFDNDETEARIELLHNPIGNWTGVVGLQLNYRDFTTNAPEDDGGHGHGGFYVRDNKTRSFGLFALENRETSFGNVEIAARLDYVDTDPADLDEDRDVDVGSFEFEQDASIDDSDFTPFSLSAGTIVPLNDTYHVRFSLSRSQRAPSSEQLYAWGEHHAAGTVELGDPNLDKETYTNLDIGLDKHLGDLTFNVTAFYNQVSDYIYLETQQDSGAAIVDDEGNVLLRNIQEDAKLYGAELTSAWKVSEGNMPVTLRLSADYVRAKLDDGGDLPRISPARVGFGFDSSYKGWQLSMDYRHVFEQNKTAELETKTDGYNLVSFDADWQPSGTKGLGFFVKGRNLLNEDGRRHQSFLKDEAPITGRALFAGIKFDFNI